MKSSAKLSLLADSLQLLNPRDKKLLVAAALVQIFLSFLDLAGVALIGVLGALSVTGVQSKAPGNRVDLVLRLLHLSDNEFQSQVALIAILAGALLLIRTILSMYFSRRIMYFLSRRGANISSTLISKMLNQDFIVVQSQTIQRTIFALTSGVTTLTLVVIGGAVSLISDMSLLIVMALGLFVVDFRLAVSTLILFSSVVFVMYRLLNLRVQKLGESESQLNIASNEKISEILTSYRENLVRGRRAYYARVISQYRIDLAATQAEISFMPNISKYVIEASLVLGALAVSAIQFKLQDATHAIATLSIFLAAGSRIAPALLRIQQSALSFKGASGAAGPTINLIRTLSKVDPVSDEISQLDQRHVGFVPAVVLSDVSLKYPGSNSWALSDINLTIKPGETVAIVGPSGAGKTSLVDVLLGVLHPSTGNVVISGVEPSESIAKWPGAISYVPQDVTITNESIKRNLALGFDEHEIDSSAIENASRIAQLQGVIKSLPLGMDTIVGERGAKLSGGQRQRVGIARALYTNPKLLVLDEATSALDGQTEADVSNAIQTLKGQVTVILIAHRLSTARHADKVYYLEKGQIIAHGSFDEVRRMVPDFDSQARLMGL